MQEHDMTEEKHIRTQNPVYFVHPACGSLRKLLLIIFSALPIRLSSSLSNKGFAVLSVSKALCLPYSFIAFHSGPLQPVSTLLISPNPSSRLTNYSSFSFTTSDSRLSPRRQTRVRVMYLDMSISHKAFPIQNSHANANLPFFRYMTQFDYRGARADPQARSARASSTTLS